MATPVMMPKVGISVESCVITKWNKKKGDSVAVGEVLFTFETDKSTLDEEATVAGTVLDIFYGDGDDVPCMANVCVIGKPGEDISAFLPPKEEETPAPAEKAPESKPEPVAVAPIATNAPKTIAEPQDGRLKISPRAKALAEKAGVDPRFAGATGAEGRICEADIRALIANPVSAAEMAAKTSAPKSAYIDEKFSGIRKAIAKNMQASLSNMAQLTHNSSFDASAILELRAAIKKGGEKIGLANITLNDIVLFAVSRVLKNHAHLNSNMIDDSTLRIFDSVNLGMAVDTDRGLMVPTLFDADKKSLNEIAIEAKTLAKECQNGTISPDKTRGATFTISNLGIFGIESFTPVINPPQVGILGVCATTTRLKPNGTPYQAMGLSLTYDHRALDGAPASKFLKDLCDTLENISLLLLK